MQKPTVPDSIQAPAGEELVLMARATGFQIYVCPPDADGKPAWTLKAPEAELFDEQGKSIGKHFGGPTWQLNDGSQITGKLAAKVDAPDPKAIPWLLVTVTGHSGSGKLSGVTSIQRVNTVGGLAPAARNARRRAGKWSSRAVIPRTTTFTRGDEIDVGRLRRSRDSKDSLPLKTPSSRTPSARGALSSAPE